MGPTTTELESFNELIQFDHVYYKTQPTVHLTPRSEKVQIKTLPSVKPSTKTVILCPSTQKVKTIDDNKNLKNVKIIITTDTSNMSNSSVNNNTNMPVLLDTNVLPSSKTEVNTMESPIDLDIDGALIELNDETSVADDLNFDLLDDLESILQADCDDLSNPDITDLQPQIIETPCTDFSSKKRKHDELENIVDCPSVGSPVISESGYSSDSSITTSPNMVPSPYSCNSLSSPRYESESLMDDETPFGETLWEESFTELFPDLL